MTILTRRTFLAASAATAGSAFLPRIASGAPFASLRAAPGQTQLLPTPYGPTDVWGYEGMAPGPEIRVKAGERVRRRLVNDLPQNTAVHWHGIRIDNAMDGAAGLTQDPVEPGGTFDYDFVAPDPGTYWYHSHDRSWEQNARGLHGPLIVEDFEPWEGLEGAATREITLLLDDWYLRDDGQIHTESFGNLHEWAHAGRAGNTFTANGRTQAEFPVRAGERVRLRIINAANARIMPLTLEGHRAKLVALDGHPVTPRDGQTITLTPAQRADVVIDCMGEPGSRAPLVLDIGSRRSVTIAELAYTDEEPLPLAGSDVRPLPMSMSHDLDLAGARRETLTMEGGAMGNLMSARLGGVDRSFTELVAAKRVWAFNGVAGDLDEPIFRARRGETVHLTIRNDTGFPHGIHLHGHHFTILSRNGVKDPHGDRRDTVLTERADVVEIAFEADNPGKWLMHCHMLEHQAAGMLSWFEVT